MKRDTRLMVRFSSTERFELEKVAAHRGVSLAEAVRLSIHTAYTSLGSLGVDHQLPAASMDIARDVSMDIGPKVDHQLPAASADVSGGIAPSAAPPPKVKEKKERKVTQKKERKETQASPSGRVLPADRTPSQASLNIPPVPSSGKQQKAPKKPSAAQERLGIAWGAWREIWTASYKRRYLDVGSDHAAMKRLATRAQSIASDSQHEPEAILRYWFSGWLAMSGYNDVLKARCHPVHMIEADLNRIGLPGERKTQPETMGRVIELHGNRGMSPAEIDELRKTPPRGWDSPEEKALLAKKRAELEADGTLAAFNARRRS